MPPLHETSVATPFAESALEGCVIVALTVAVHPLSSVIVTSYIPAVRFVAVAVVCEEVSFQEYIYGAVPDEGVTVKEPLEPPLQLTLVCEVIEAVIEQEPVLKLDIVRTPAPQQLSPLYTLNAKVSPAVTGTERLPLPLKVTCVAVPFMT